MSDSSIHYLGIDGGGTGCRARVTDAAGRVLGLGQAGPASLRLGVDAAWAALMQAADAALQTAGLDPARNAVCTGIGVAGVGRLGALAQLRAKPHRFASLQIGSDALTACLGAHGGGDGGVVIAGTGSVGFARQAGREIRIGGYGFPVSDQGSGAWLGLEALKMALLAHDGRREMTPLLGQLMGRFDDDAFQLVAWMEKATATDYATLAPLVMQGAAARDAAGCDLMAGAAVEIAALILALTGRGVARVALLGGLAAGVQPWLPVEAGARLCPLQGDGIDGALYLAGLAP